MSRAAAILAFKSITISVLISASCIAADGDLSLEGVMVSPGAGHELCAMVNGRIVRKGDSFGDYTVSQVRQNGVLLKPSSGGSDLYLALGTSQKTQPLSTENDDGDTDRVKSRAISDATAPQLPADTASLASKIQESAGKMNAGLAGMFNLAEETKTMSEIRQIWTAAMVIANQEEYDSQGQSVMPQITLQKMVERQLLPKYFASGVSGKYRYTISCEGHEFEIHADPADPRSTLRHFMADSQGTMYAESGRPATRDSQRP